VPPLRERREDIAVLAEHFWRDATERVGSRATLAPTTIAALARYDWPGNVRELQNLIERAAVLARGEIITPEHISFFGTDSRRLFDVGTLVRRGTSLDDLLDSVEQAALEEALAAADGDRVEAAALLGLKLPQLNKRISALGVGSTR
jgi:DNA-binding NtrC family response regulator